MNDLDFVLLCFKHAPRPLRVSVCVTRLLVVTVLSIATSVYLLLLYLNAKYLHMIGPNHITWASHMGTVQ